MTDHDYWWDRSGAVDPEIRNLEKLLSPLGHGASRRRRVKIGYGLLGVAMAAALALFWTLGDKSISPKPESWGVRSLAGAPRIDNHAVAKAATLSVGQWLATDDSSACDLLVSNLGHVRVEPGSRIFLKSSDSLGYVIRLEEGMIHAAMWAPPRRFMVETKAATAYDLGCEYTLTVDEHGKGVLCVETGWVSLEHEGRIALVPSGAQCEMRQGIGPGTPYLAGASSDYLDLLRSFDFDAAPAAPVEQLIESASPCDAFSLVYLVDRVGPPERGRIFDRVAALYPPWKGITRAGIVALERTMVATWQDQFECFETETCRASCMPDVL